jgi:hypothetical protein
MTTELNVVPLVPRLTLVGFSDKGAMITLGTLPLDNPEERETTISSILESIETCAKEETMCRVGNVSFYPSAFDFFMVN